MSCSGLFSISIKDVKNADIGVFWVENGYLRDIFAKYIYTKGICFGGIYIKGTYIGDIYIGIRNLMFWNSYIYSSANNSYKFIVIDIKLLINLELVILISSYLRLIIILDNLS